tara:strand:+ start:3721 stop:3999 length:279 start_codon:yes stop_codon:yes gene_type:complete
MATLVSASLDVTKIKKQKLKDGKYLNITVSINDNTNKYGQNVGVYETQSKEERERDEKKNYVGNGKVVWTDGNVELAQKDEQKEESTPDLPF